MKLRRFPRLFLALVCISATAAAEQLQDNERIVIERLDDLPRLAYPAEMPLEEWLEDRDALLDLARRVETDMRERLERFDIRDASTLRATHNTLRTIAYLRGDHDAALRHIETIRELQEKPGDRLTNGLLLEAVIEAERRGEAFTDVYAAKLADLPWSVVNESILDLRAGLQTMGEGLYRGALRSQMQPVVDQSGELSLGIATSLISFRYMFDAILPRRDDAVEVLTEYIEANREDKPDIWAERSVDLTDRDDLTPVIVAVWDSGLDPEVFEPMGNLWRNPDEAHDGTDTSGNGWVDDVHGIGWDKDYRREAGELMPLTEEERARYPESVALTKGFTDLQAGVDSPEAQLVRERMSGLEPEAYEEFVENLSLFGSYVHGTHVAGIAAEGNPAIRLLNARITFGHKLLPEKPTLELAVRSARATRDAVAYFRENGVRVVNMSWGGTQAGYEYALQANGVGDDAEMRAEMARVLFGIGYRALVEAMEEAEDILFIPAAGNSDDDVDFTQVIPSSIDLPNVLVVGAVDQAGDETSFTSHGRNVAVHANGLAVESWFPGGERVAISGTSMSAPNVANLAAKLLAVDPSLTPVEVREIIVSTAERTEDGRRNLIHPRRAMEALEARR
ncbi:MAG: S8 family serine peptidase [Opitutales bacterium]|nr:S8 family serine peptidase [Opitutales bacterium]